MTAIDLFWAVVAGNIISMFAISMFNYTLDIYNSNKRRAKFDEILAQISSEPTRKKTVKKQVPKKNG